MDYYEILGILSDASENIIRTAYKQQALACHPDKNPLDPNATKKFQTIAEAFGVLTDPEKRGLYDQYKNQYGHERAVHFLNNPEQRPYAEPQAQEGKRQSPNQTFFSEKSEYNEENHEPEQGEGAEIRQQKEAQEKIAEIRRQQKINGYQTAVKQVFNEHFLFGQQESTLTDYYARNIAELFWRFDKTYEKYYLENRTRLTWLKPFQQAREGLWDCLVQYPEKFVTQSLVLFENKTLQDETFLYVVVYIPIDVATTHSELEAERRKGSCFQGKAAFTLPEGKAILQVNDFKQRVNFFIDNTLPSRGPGFFGALSKSVHEEAKRNLQSAINNIRATDKCNEQSIKTAFSAFNAALIDKGKRSFSRRHEAHLRAFICGLNGTTDDKSTSTERLIQELTIEKINQFSIGSDKVGLSK